VYYLFWSLVQYIRLYHYDPSWEPFSHCIHEV
jgi:hypothetical protein